MGVIYGCGLSATSGMVTSAMSGGPGVEAHTTLSAARCRARVHRLQYFCRRRVWAAGVEGRFRSIFQAELDHFRRARPAQLRDKGQHEIAAWHQEHVARLDRSQVVQVRKGEAVRRNRFTSQRSHPDMQVGCTREKLVRPSEVELGHALVHRHYYADWL